LRPGLFEGEERGVFQTYVYVSLAASYCSPLFAAVDATAGPVTLQPASSDVGESAARMPSPRSPPRLNLTGTAWPALTVLTIGGLSIGRWNPPNG
jgi:hypothetical protein